MGAAETKPKQLQLLILEGMADDYEDVEQLYLYANGLLLPRTSDQIRFPLREIMDEIANMLREGWIEPKYSNDEKSAPLSPINPVSLHHYWFGPTNKGMQAWKLFRSSE